MPRYDTLNCRANPSELDPCIAAEVRLKDKHYSWKVIGGGLAILFVLIVGVIVVCTMSFTSKHPILAQPSSYIAGRPHTTTTYPPASSLNNFYESRTDYVRRMQIIQDKRPDLAKKMDEMKPPLTNEKILVDKTSLDRNMPVDKATMDRKPTFNAQPTPVKALETPFSPFGQQESALKFGTLAPVTPIPSTTVKITATTVRVTLPPTTSKMTSSSTTKHSQLLMKMFNFQASKLTPTTTTLEPIVVDTYIVQKEEKVESSRPDVLPASTTTTQSTAAMKTSHPTILPAKTSYSTRSDKLPTSKRGRKIQATTVSEIDTSGKFETCEDYLKNGYTASGVYRLRSDYYDFRVQCIMDNDGDGKAWMLMQTRTSSSLVFWNRTFEEYAQGFGDATSDNWLGLRNVRQMIETGKRLQLQVEIEGDRCGGGEDTYYIGVWDFEIDSEKDDFRLHVSKILRGNFTDPLSNIANSNNLQFNAIRPEGANLFSCLDRVHMGGWWSVENGCPFISLNGEYSCARSNSMYGLSVYYRRLNRNNPGTFTTSYIRPQATRMMLRVCNGERDCV